MKLQALAPPPPPPPPPSPPLPGVVANKYLRWGTRMRLDGPFAAIRISQEPSIRELMQVLGSSNLQKVVLKLLN